MLQDPLGNCRPREPLELPHRSRRPPGELLSMACHAPLPPELLQFWDRCFQPLPLPRPLEPPPELPSEVEVLREALEPSLPPPSSDFPGAAGGGAECPAHSGPAPRGPAGDSRDTGDRPQKEFRMNFFSFPSPTQADPGPRPSPRGGGACYHHGPGLAPPPCSQGLRSVPGSLCLPLAAAGAAPPLRTNPGQAPPTAPINHAYIALYGVQGVFGWLLGGIWDFWVDVGVSSNKSAGDHGLMLWESPLQLR
ncbi:meiotic recombination protein REC8 homolog isoform 1-T2 [Acridotheres tristis]